MEEESIRTWDSCEAEMISEEEFESLHMDGDIFHVGDVVRVTSMEKETYGMVGVVSNVMVFQSIPPVEFVFVKFDFRDETEVYVENEVEHSRRSAWSEEVI